MSRASEILARVAALKRQRQGQAQPRGRGSELLARVAEMKRARPAPARLLGEIRKVANRADGRPSDAVRAYLNSPAGRAQADRRGELLALSRTTIQDMRSRKAHLVPRPTKVVVRPDNELLTIEPFGGGGLFGLASALEGNAEVDGCEIEPFAVKTRKANRKALNLRHEPKRADARKWKPILTTPHGIDVLYGGPPCKVFSKGAQLGRVASERAWDSKDNFFPIALDWICDLQPRVVCFENSPQLVTKKEYRTWIAEWQEQVGYLGYDSVVHLLKAADFGNPTQRTRVFVMAWPRGAPWGPGLKVKPQGSFAKPGSAEVKRGDKLPWKPMVDRLTSGCCGGWGLVDCVFLGGYALKCRGCSAGQNFYPAPNTGGDDGRRGYKGVMIDTDYGRMPWHKWIRQTVGGRQPRFDKYTPADAAGAYTDLKLKARDLALPGRRVSEYLMRTVVPNFTNKAEGLMIGPDVEARHYGATRQWGKEMLEGLQSMSVRDAAKLQDLPQWYRIEGTRTQAFSQIGMGVPVNLGRGVMAHIRKAMGLAVLAPWWETSVPVIPRQTRFQTVAQIKAGASKVELTEGGGDGYPDGLWPMDTMDMCFAVGPTLDFGPLLQQHVVDDWQLNITHGMVGAQAQRQDGRSKLQRGARVLPTSPQRQQRLKRAQIVGRVFTGEGLDLEELWRSGHRELVWPPEFMPGMVHEGTPQQLAAGRVPGQARYDTDPLEEWLYFLAFSSGPWKTQYAMHMREFNPYAFTESGAAEPEQYGLGWSWDKLLPLDGPLPQQVPLVAPGDRSYTQAELKAARKRTPAYYQRRWKKHLRTHPQGRLPVTLQWPQSIPLGEKPWE